MFIKDNSLKYYISGIDFTSCISALLQFGKITMKECVAGYIMVLSSFCYLGI